MCKPYILQISLNGMEVLCLLVDRMGENFQRHIPSGESLMHMQYYFYRHWAKALELSYL